MKNNINNELLNKIKDISIKELMDRERLLYVNTPSLLSTKDMDIMGSTPEYDKLYSFKGSIK